MGGLFGFWTLSIWLCMVFNQVKLEMGTFFIFKSIFPVKKELLNP